MGQWRSSAPRWGKGGKGAALSADPSPAPPLSPPPFSPFFSPSLFRLFFAFSPLFLPLFPLSPLSFLFPPLSLPFSPLSSHFYSSPLFFSPRFLNPSDPSPFYFFLPLSRIFSPHFPSVSAAPPGSCGRCGRPWPVPASGMSGALHSEESPPAAIPALPSLMGCEPGMEWT